MAAASVMNTIGAAASGVGRTFRRGLSSLSTSPAKNKQAGKLSKVVPDASMVDGEVTFSSGSRSTECPSNRAATLDDFHASKCAAGKEDNPDDVSYALLESPPASDIAAEGNDEEARAFDVNPDDVSYTLLESPPASDIAAEDFDEEARVFDDNPDDVSYALLESPPASDIAAEDFDEEASVFDD